MTLLKFKILTLSIIITFISLLNSSCNNESIESNLTVLVDCDTIYYGEVVTAKLCLKNIDDSIYPTFYILHRGDTAQIPVEKIDDKICGIFKAVGRNQGSNNYNGFVEYYHKKKEFKKEEFSIEFFVKNE